MRGASGGPNYGPVGGGNYGPAPSHSSQGPTANYYTGGVSGGNYGEPVMRGSGKTPMDEVFFAAACCIIVGSLTSGFKLVMAFQITDWLFMTFMMAFGILLAILDLPIFGNLKSVSDIRMYTGKYLQLMTRMSGKGIALLFMGSALFMQMWDNLEGGFWEFLAVVLSMVPAVVGILAIAYGGTKSAKLEKARKALELQVDHRYDYYAKRYPGANGGLTMDEFRDLFRNDHGISFDFNDTKFIFNALSSHPSWRPAPGMAALGNQQSQPAEEEPKLSKQDLVDWCQGSWVML
mmetsp:Transcript_49629/g.105633  ORF Transcript_49629/g.105633 Transcript_49629/m.105633 type:complete len:291 (-) Transcript_49629:527-1399(-)|eukprot:CAMPEP_0206487406 /NCGR_PEP_ID=MMETSP0324_2-20121206/41621_1 /ASSEMBLY_ACC=CAM_ASM_000836 /TAXON_ID=2866 /ORGANISM="Crypthecodinium cohnii, Strain Seligo" /LENGTH=290 /DNA_ID=CAMNT_0053965879 /DNA_START=199 /DNA_END=1071 /DNA_ORIENTATION=+